MDTGAGDGSELVEHRVGHEPLTVVEAPPERVGLLLADARTAQGLRLSEVADAVGGLSADDVLAIERGERSLEPEMLSRFVELYGIDLTTEVPPRSQLVVDLNEGFLRAGPGMVAITEADHTDILRRYLDLVARMRADRPNPQMALRNTDLDVLARSLGMPRDQLSETLTELLADDVTDAPGPEAAGDLVPNRADRPRGIAVAVAVVLGLVAVGLLVWGLAAGSRADDPVTSIPPTTTPPPSVVRPTTAEPAGTDTSVASTIPAQVLPPEDAVIGDAITQERAPDGSEGPVESRPEG